jgi:oligopeptide/dipeptide ABC transporter ATP-binding protein
VSASLLEVRDLCVHFRSRCRGQRRAQIVRAVDGVSFEIERGAALGLVGESGSGKSTLGRALVGLERVTRGSIRLDSVELARLNRRQWMPHRRRIQWIAQDPTGALDPRQTVGAVLAEPMAIHGLAKPRERRMRALALLEVVGLNPRHLNRYPHEFSGGQRQRICIARALALEPELIICDEPVSALDVSIQAQVIALLRDLRERFGLAYLFIAHDLAVVRHLCPEVCVMYLGRFVERGPRELVYKQPAHPYTQALLASVPLSEAASGLRKVARLEGDPPSAADPPRGCVFHPRCPRRSEVPEDRCRRVLPLLEAHGDARRACACHLDLDRELRRAPLGA